MTGFSPRRPAPAVAMRPSPEHQRGQRRRVGGLFLRRSSTSRGYRRYPGGRPAVPGWPCATAPVNPAGSSRRERRRECSTNSSCYRTSRCRRAGSGGEREGHDRPRKTTLEYGSAVPREVRRGSRLRFRQDIALEIAVGEYTSMLAWAPSAARTTTAVLCPPTSSWTRASSACACYRPRARSQWSSVHGVSRCSSLITAWPTFPEAVRCRWPMPLGASCQRSRSRLPAGRWIGRPGRFP